MFPKQVQYIEWLHERFNRGEEGACDKPRDMGVSWLNCWFSLWVWLFVPNGKVGMGSYVMRKVDRKGDPDSLFEKIRMGLNMLPLWMRPTGFNEDEDDNFARIIHPNGNTITGESGDQMGRGGRCSIYIVDESAHLDRPDKVDMALASVSDCVIHVSTANGSGNPFFKKIHGGNMSVFRFIWSDDPRKTKQWYEKKKKTMDPIIFAQEIDKDYSATIENICIPEPWVRAAVNLKIPAEGSTVAGLDVSDGGRDKNALCIIRGVKVIDLRTWSGSNTVETAYKSAILAQEEGACELRYDCVGVGSGVKAAALTAEESFNFKWIPVNGGAPALKKKMPGENKTTYRDRYRNITAQGWWDLRRRFEKVFEMKEGKGFYPIEELISIPNDEDLIMQLSSRKYEYGQGGKLKMESKKAMKKRGIKSPDKVDALWQCFIPVQSMTPLEIL